MTDADKREIVLFYHYRGLSPTEACFESRKSGIIIKRDEYLRILRAWCRLMDRSRYLGRGK